ncbi:Glycyl-tRNA synthetase [Orpheovirus IHUMI-LCC2]|uniref:Glycyl-tRNA synthetase n=1 Tax=Orpheovirus IHUMI-LCC2 TaxID=2023057 RepID=A0A2I2L3K8_9VIRU|nr:Glycyl-tRNA synthetase [Orpheovirus IHUMI-LCC2]SNW62113.1 Glycyl-tRNA synthetase [Orpheovirus IHUMI-LCC2]
MENKDLIKFYGFLREHGWVWGPEPEIYNPINGHYTYGPLGASLKNEVEGYIRGKFRMLDAMEVKCPLIYPKITWENSGHWNKFQDPIIQTKSGSVYRLDKLIEGQFNLQYGDLSLQEIKTYRDKLDAINKDDPYVYGEDIEYKNLMMTTHSGSVLCGLRPETATTTYTCFDNAYTFFGKALPFGLYQIGYAFRNEPNPRQNLLRCREFTQAEAQIFTEQDDVVCPEFEEIKHQEAPVLATNGELQMKPFGEMFGDGMKKYGYMVYTAYKLFVDILPKENVRLRRHAENERAFYALDAWDIEVNIGNVGWVEVAGIHHRGTYDLTQHSTANIKRLEKVPYVLELAIGVDRTVFALLDNYIDKKSIDQGKSILGLPYNLSPIKIAVLPLVKNKEDIVNKSKEVYKLLKGKWNAIYEDGASIGKRYLKCGFKGIPYCITIDYKTLEDGTVTVRDRDSETQEKVKLQDLNEWLHKRA